MPVEPPPTVWDLPPASSADDRGVVGIGADLEPSTLLAAYRSGLFPMPVEGGAIAVVVTGPAWIVPLDGLRISRSLRRSISRYRISIDRDFDAVIAACADPGRPHGWINDEIRTAYTRLHGLGWAHSIEAWADDDLVGGLYGVAIGGLFAGESMFHRQTDASKVVLVHLVDLLRAGGASLLDVQWTTPHLATLGAVDVPRTEYLTRLGEALQSPLPAPFQG